MFREKEKAEPSTDCNDIYNQHTMTNGLPPHSKPASRTMKVTTTATASTTMMEKVRIVIVLLMQKAGRTVINFAARMKYRLTPPLRFETYCRTLHFCRTD